MALVMFCGIGLGQLLFQGFWGSMPLEPGPIIKRGVVFKKWAWSATCPPHFSTCSYPSVLNRLPLREMSMQGPELGETIMLIEALQSSVVTAVHIQL